MKKEQQDPNHHMGKQTGYTLNDGIYHVAPLYSEQFEKIREQEAGISEMLNIVTKHASDDLAALAKQGKEVWGRLYEDIGLDPTKKWQWSSDGTVREIIDTKSK
jgi:hypothetical protein